MVVAALASASPANAADAYIDSATLSLNYLTYAGEDLRNDVTVVAERSGDLLTFTATETAAPLAAGQGCRQAGTNAVVCVVAYTGSNGIDANLSPAADEFAVFAPDAVQRERGAGNPAEAAVRATLGRVVVRGNAGSDDLRIALGQVEEAELIGGSGDDTLSIRPDFQGVTKVDEMLSRTSAHVRTAVLDGGPGYDWLFGWMGDATLLGGSDNDRLLPGFGFDVVDAGDGWDFIDTRDAHAEAPDCGAGVDLLYADQHDSQMNCEHVTVF